MSASHSHSHLSPQLVGAQLNRPKYRPTTQTEEKEHNNTNGAQQHQQQRFHPVHPTELGMGLRSRQSPSTHPIMVGSPNKRVARRTEILSGRPPMGSSSNSDLDLDEPNLAHQMRSDICAAAAAAATHSRTSRSLTQQHPSVYAAQATPVRTTMQSLRDELADAEEEDGGVDPTIGTAPPAGDTPDTDLDALLAPIDSSRIALEAEIKRLQALLSQSPARVAAAAVQEQIHAGTPAAAAHAISAEAAEAPSSHRYTNDDPYPSSNSLLSHPVSSPTSPPRRPFYTSRRRPSSTRVIPPHRSLYMSRTPVDPYHLDSWLNQPTRTLTSARQRLAEREKTIRAYLHATAQWWSIIIIKAGLTQLKALRGSNAVRAALSLPFVRTILEFSCSASLKIFDYALHTRLFRMLPGSNFIHDLLTSSELCQEWSKLGTWPEQAVLPIMEGPFGEIWKSMAQLPIIGRIIHKQQVEQDTKKDDEQREIPIVKSNDSNGSSIGVSSLPSTDSTNLVDGPMFLDLVARLDTQSSLIAYLQEDRLTLLETLRELRQIQGEEMIKLKKYAEQQVKENEKLMEDIRRQQQQQEQERNVNTMTIARGSHARNEGLRNRKTGSNGIMVERNIHIDGTTVVDDDDDDDADPVVDAFSPVKSVSGRTAATGTGSSSSSHSRDFMSAAAESRLHELMIENVELRGLAGAQESSIQAHELTIQALTEETEILAERIYELEDQIKAGGTK